MRRFLSSFAVLCLLAGCEAATTYDSGAVVLDISEPEAFNDRLETTTTFIEATEAIEAGDYTRAEALLDNSLAQKPRDPYALLAMGSLHERTGRFHEAAEYYRSAERYGFAAAGPRIIEGKTVPSETGLTVSDAARENLARLAP
jgi:Tfp pilus assembly protein PilF